jgi:hypothetical protein
MTTTGRWRCRRLYWLAVRLWACELTGAAFVRHGETGIVVDRLPPGRQCAESDDDVRALAAFMEAIEQAQAMDLHSVRDRAAGELDTDRIVDSIINAVNTVRLAGGIGTAASEQSQP